MRTLSPRHSNALSAIFVFILTLLLAACDLPLRDDASQTAVADSASALDNIVPASNGGGATSGICDAIEASTILTPVPNPPRDGAPIDVRIRYNRPDGNYADWGLHLWQVNDAGQYIADYPGVSWPSPLVRSGVDDYGAYFDIRTYLAAVVSGTRTMMTSAHSHACAGSRTVTPCACAFAREPLAAGSPTRTSTPLSRRLSACACPCDP